MTKAQNVLPEQLQEILENSAQQLGAQERQVCSGKNTSSLSSAGPEAHHKPPCISQGLWRHGEKTLGV